METSSIKEGNYGTMETSSRKLRDNGDKLNQRRKLTLEAIDEVIHRAGGSLLRHAHQVVDHARGHGLALCTAGEREKRMRDGCGAAARSGDTTR
jgi:hypothetical protein